MKDLKFKTNINCTNCLAKVTPVLDANPEIESWTVDLKSPERFLHVKTENLDAEQVEKAVLKSGFVAKSV